MQLDDLKNRRPINLVWSGLLFGVIYWMFEAIRNTLNNNGSEVFQAIFNPDVMEFWMRFLVVNILILFGIMAYKFYEKLDISNDKKASIPGQNEVISMCAGFSVLYWLLESVRDSIIFDKGSLAERIFQPDSMSVWMRMLPIFIVILFGLYINILLTDRKKLLENQNKALVVSPEKEQDFSALKEHITVGVFKITLKGELLEINRAFLSIFGYKRKSELIATPISNLFDNDRNRLDLDKKLRLYGKVREEEYLMKKRNGDTLWISVFAIAVRDSKGKLLYYEGIIEDITKRKDMALEIENRRLYLESVMSCAPVAIVTLNRKHQVIDWNPGAEKMFGYRRNEVLNIDIDRLIIDADNHDRCKSMAYQVLSGKNMVAFETIRYKKDRTPVNVLCSASPIYIDNVLNGIVIVYEDISQMVEAELELTRLNRSLKTLSEGRKALLQANCIDGLFEEVCNSLIDNGKYAFAWAGIVSEKDPMQIKPIAMAASASSWLGTKNKMGNLSETLTERALISIRSGKNLIETSLESGMSRIILPLIANDELLGMLSIYSRQNSTFDKKEVLLLEEMAGDLAFGISVIHTKSSQQRIEDEKKIIHQQLLQAQKMEAIGVLTGGIAHDFNNLLTAIIGCSDMALLDVDKDDPVYIELQDIQSAANKAADLTSQLLLFSRKQPMKFESVNIASVTNDLLKLLRRLLGENIRIKTDFPKDIWNICADKGTIEQVIMNLSVNARDAMPDGGSISIKARNIIMTEENSRHISECKPGKYIRLSFTDTGSGISEDVQKQIFDPFFSTKGKSKGTGLGLSVVYGIVKQHEGWIYVISKEDEGAEFVIYLPAMPRMSSSREKIAKITSDLKGEGKRVLVVEDEEKVREFTINGLSRTGFEVFSAGSAAEAKDIFAQEAGDFDLIISDIGLPGQSGFDLVNELVLQKPDLKVLLSSGYSDHNSRWPLIKKKGYKFLEKPYALNDLLCEMHNLDS